MITTLKQLEDTHKDARNHSCETSNKLFLTKRALNRHLEVHNKLKPFTCELCRKSFAVQSHFKALPRKYFFLIYSDYDFLPTITYTIVPELTFKSANWPRSV